MVRGLGGGDRWWLRNFKFAFCFLWEMPTWAPGELLEALAASVYQSSDPVSSDPDEMEVEVGI